MSEGGKGKNKRGRNFPPIQYGRPVFLQVSIMYFQKHATTAGLHFFKCPLCTFRNMRLRLACISSSVHYVLSETCNYGWPAFLQVSIMYFQKHATTAGLHFFKCPLCTFRNMRLQLACISSSVHYVTTRNCSKMKCSTLVSTSQTSMYICIITKFLRSFLTFVCFLVVIHSSEKFVSAHLANKNLFWKMLSELHV